MIYKLGKLPVRHDPRTLKLKTFLKAVPPVPASVDWGGKVQDWKMLANDSVGDCTCAGAGHADMLWTANAAAQTAHPTDDQILSAYSAITGYNPADPNTDQGANMLDVLKYWRSTGIAGTTIQAFVSVDWMDPKEVAAAIYLFGCLYIGVNLPQSAEDAFGAGQPWADTTDTNILGGHCVLLTGYDQGTVKLVTWGKEITATLEWLKTYCEESYAILTPAWIEATGQAPSGFDMAQLDAKLAQIAA
jgi:hypothetical protein